MEQRQTIDYLLEKLAGRPEWLEAVFQPEQVLPALARQIPEAAAGKLRLAEISIPRLFLKDTSGRWTGVGELAVEGLPGSAQQVLKLRVTLAAPGRELPAEAQAAEPRPFGAEGWRCEVPELRLFLELEPPERALEVLQRLTDAEQARRLLEESIAAGAPAYRGFRIRACRPQVLNYKPGSRCTIRYDLDYPPEVQDHGWPMAVIVKTYRAQKGERAYQGMADLWRSPLASSSTVRIAEPLAYVPELRLLIQEQLPEERTLEELIQSVLPANLADGGERLMHFVRKSADGLARLHQSGVRARQTVAWDERVQDIPELAGRLAVVDPDLAAAIQPLFAHLLALAAQVPPDPRVPSHGSFDSDQVLIAGEEIGFIDFDSFCSAEPALDVGHFRAAVMDSGMKLIEESTLQDPVLCQAYLKQLDEIGEGFLEQYQANAPVSRQRLAVWEALDYFRDALHHWTKPKPGSGLGVIRILEYQLRKMGLLD